jgi:hypothetical protein
MISLFYLVYTPPHLVSRLVGVKCIFQTVCSKLNLILLTTEVVLHGRLLADTALNIFSAGGPILSKFNLICRLLLGEVIYSNAARVILTGDLLFNNIISNCIFVSII